MTCPIRQLDGYSLALIAERTGESILAAHERRHVPHPANDQGGCGRCGGECGIDHGGRCTAKHLELHPTTGIKVVLTTAHLADPIEDCRDENLRAMCQQCHNRYDMPSRRAGIRQRAFADQGRLFPEAAS